MHKLPRILDQLPPSSPTSWRIGRQLVCDIVLQKSNVYQPLVGPKNPNWLFLGFSCSVDRVVARDSHTTHIVPQLGERGVILVTASALRLRLPELNHPVSTRTVWSA